MYFQTITRPFMNEINQTYSYCWKIKFLVNVGMKLEVAIEYLHCKYQVYCWNERKWSIHRDCGGNNQFSPCSHSSVGVTQTDIIGLFRDWMYQSGKENHFWRLIYWKNLFADNLNCISLQEVQRVLTSILLLLLSAKLVSVFFKNILLLTEWQRSLLISLMVPTKTFMKMN